MLVVLSHELWRRICPLAFLSGAIWVGSARYSTNRAKLVVVKPITPSTPSPGLDGITSNCNGAC